MNNIVKVQGLDLNDNELNQINSSLFREWKLGPYTREKHADTLFFFFKEGDEILAMGGLKTVTPVFFNGEEFSILGAVEVIANIKGKGYGKNVVSSMREYLISSDSSGIGFTHKMNIGFYEKCGFKIEQRATQRFVYHKGEERITNQDGQVIFYQDCSDHFMKKVLSQLDKEVSIPTDALW